MCQQTKSNRGVKGRFAPVYCCPERMSPAVTLFGIGPGSLGKLLCYFNVVKLKELHLQSDRLFVSVRSGSRGEIAVTSLKFMFGLFGKV